MTPPKAQNPDALPTVTGKNRKLKVRAHLEEFGRTWDLIRPNQIIVAKLAGSDEGDLDVSYILDFFKAHVHPDQRDDFVAAAAADDTLEIEDFMELMDAMTKAVYGDDLPSEPS